MSHLKTAIRAIGRPINIVFCGLDFAGKTAMYIRLKSGNFNQDLMPTISSTMDTIDMDDGLLQATIFDLGGQRMLREQWQVFIEKSDIILFIIDASDNNRFSEVKEEFHKRIIPNIKNKPCIIVCNKIDLLFERKIGSYDANELIKSSIREIQELLGISNEIEHIFIATSQKTGQGLPKVTRHIREILT